MAWSIPIVSCLFVYAIASKEDIEKQLELGKQFLAKGQFSDALVHYHAAIELDPTNYQTLYRRATVYLAMGRSKSALPDLDKVVELKADFTAARVQRGNVLLKQGDIDGAERDFRAALDVDPSNAEYSEKIRICAEMRSAVHEANAMHKTGDTDGELFFLNAALEHMMWDSTLYRKRSKCYEKRGEVVKAITDMRTLTKLESDSTEIFLEISRLYYGIGDIENSLEQIRECLKLNPDHKECFPFYKRVKKLAKMRENLEAAKNNGDWMKCLENGQSVLKFEREVPNVQLDVFRVTCKCNREAGHLQEAIDECTQVLEHSDENDLEALCERAEAYLLSEMYDEAIEDFQKAQKAHEGVNRPREGLERAQKLKKQAGRKDYYKILGVKRTANKREIMKAYRKAAHKWHPDNFADDKEKKKAEAKFIDIAAAKEVLTDEEKRRRFDQGEDPLDPEQQQHGGHGFPHGFHGFPGGGFPFGGGNGDGFSFKFHFG